MGVLEGQIALVTGSSSGIGKAIAEGFAREGAVVYTHGHTPDGYLALPSALQERYFCADFRQTDAVQALAEHFMTRESRLDILVNNAGMEIVMPLADLDIQHYDAMMAVNVRAPFELTHRLLPMLQRSRAASIINITSIHDTMPYPHNAVYSASKAALAMFGKTIAVELAPLGIRVNNFAPGAVETEINREVIQAIGEENFRAWIPLGRVAQTDEMVAPAVFLASDAASYITGVTLYADGAYLQNLVRYRP
jgi:NAD(P)-dependent dehydrogenase (short-subunit alcohol dehydrogenase family)